MGSSDAARGSIVRRRGRTGPHRGRCGIQPLALRRRSISAALRGNTTVAEIGGTFFYRVAPEDAGSRAGEAHRHHARRRPTPRQSRDAISRRRHLGSARNRQPARSGSGCMTKDFSEPWTRRFFRSELRSGGQVVAADLFDARFHREARLWRNARSRKQLRRQRRRYALVESRLAARDSLDGHLHLWSGLTGRAGSHRHVSPRGLKVSYAIRRWLQAGAGYRHDIRDSTNTAADYKRNLTFITLEAAL